MRVYSFVLILLLIIEANAVTADKNNAIKWLEAFQQTVNGTNHDALINFGTAATINQLRSFSSFPVTYDYIFVHPIGEQEQLLDIAVSTKNQEGNYNIRNHPVTFHLKNNRVTEIKNLQQTPRDFWSALLCADDLLIINSSDRGKTITLSFLSNGLQYHQNSVVPTWVLYRIRQPGKYLLPVKKEKKSFVEVIGSNYSLPSLISLKQLQFFRQLLPAREEAWLFQALQDSTDTQTTQSIIERFIAIGHFHYSMTSYNRKKWFSILKNARLNNYSKRLLLEKILENNYIASDPFIDWGLMQQSLAEITGRICQHKDRRLFEIKMQKWAQDDSKWRYALWQSHRLSQLTVQENLLRHFKDAPPQDLIYFIPLLCQRDKDEGAEIVKKLFRNEYPDSSILLIKVAAEWVYKTNPQPYVQEMKFFLHKNSQSDYLKRSIVYPTMLASLCKAKDKDGYRMSVEYLAQLEEPVQVENAKRIFVPKHNGSVTIEKIIESFQGQY